MRIVTFFLAVFAVVFISISDAAAVSVMFNPVDDRWALGTIPYGGGVGADLQPDGTFLQVGNAFVSGQAPITGEYRAALEFNLSSLSGAATSWTLQLTPAATQAVTNLNVYGYFGNGTVDLSDMLHTSTLVASGTIPPFTSGTPLSLDVTSFVQAAITGGQNVLGFTLLNPSIIANNPALYTQIASRNNATAEWRPALAAEMVAPVPVPAAAVLFCSGLLGLVGIARRATRQPEA